MLHVFIGEILADMTQVSDVAPGPLFFFWLYPVSCNALQLSIGSVYRCHILSFLTSPFITPYRTLKLFHPLQFLEFYNLHICMVVNLTSG
jgi:hypothetical protein